MIEWHSNKLYQTKQNPDKKNQILKGVSSLKKGLEILRKDAEY